MFSTRKQYLYKTPAQYMHDKIQQARTGLAAPELPDTALHMDTSEAASSSEDQADDELSATDSLSPPLSPLLPYHKRQASPSSIDRTIQLMAQPTSIVLVATLVFVISTAALSILDRFNMYQATYKFPYPLCLLAIELIFVEAIIIALGLIARILLHYQYKHEWHEITVPEGLILDLRLEAKTLRALLPVSLSFLIAHASAKACLEYVPMSYFILFLSPMMPIQLALTKYFNPKAPQTMAIAATCMILLCGYIFVGVNSSATVQGIAGFNYHGLLAGLIASIALPVHHALLSSSPAFSPATFLSTLHVILSTSIMLLLPLLVMTGEIFRIVGNCYFLDEKGFWGMLAIVSGVAVLAIFSTATLLLYVTPVTLVVLYFAKTILFMSPMSNLLSRNMSNMFNFVGWFIGLGATIGYLYLINQHRPRFGLCWK